MGSSMDFDQLVEQLETVFDEAVVSGTDDELFASGYLRGHFDLVVAQLEMAGETQPENIMPALREAVHKTRHELSPADQAHINNVIDKLALKATNGNAA
ncbi:YfcL family protein [Idiomarina ramblicola]|uniref:YfcL family protein n=1 Tax=Idiomarina ramblicola TaxID=263724 RepID=A0A432YVD0_9GAMM|nr:YfcL family protein [Idiomarina ramblicola]RUO67266.1 hypothetical protein CWI78_10495 [Idiomarina ramblicola]